MGTFSELQSVKSRVGRQPPVTSKKTVLANMDIFHSKQCIWRRMAKT